MRPPPRPLAAALLLLAILSPVSPVRAQADADSLFAEGRALVAEGKYAEALVRLEECCRANPSHISYRLERGRCLTALGRDKEALPDFDFFIERAGTEWANVLVERGWTRDRLGDASGAMGDFEIASKSANPEFAAMGRTALAQVAFFHGEHEKALKALDGAVGEEAVKQAEKFRVLIRGPFADAYKEGARFLEGWTDEKARLHYLYTDLGASTSKKPKARSKEFEAVSKVLGLLHAEHERVLGKADRFTPLHVYYFSKESEMQAFAERIGYKPDAYGRYTPIEKICYVHDEPFFPVRLAGTQEIFPGFLHEVTHHHVQELIGYGVDTWLNEGFGLFFGHYYRVNLKAGKLDRIAGMSNWIDLASADLAGKGRFLGLEELLTMGPKEFYEATDVTYPESYSMIRYLMGGEPGRDYLTSVGGGEAIVKEMIDSMRHGVRGRALYDALFGPKNSRGIDTAKLSAEFTAFVQRIGKAKYFDERYKR